MRTFAAIIAAAMTATAMGTMNAFADGHTNSSENYSGQTSINDVASIPLEIIASERNVSSEATVDSNYNDTNNYIWSIAITANELSWNVEKVNTISGGTYGLKWNANSLKYEIDNNVGTAQTTSTSYDFLSGETPVKSYNVINNSNFNINCTNYIQSLEGAPEGLFKFVTDNSGDTVDNDPNFTLAIGQTVPVYIKLDKSVEGFDSLVDLYLTAVNDSQYASQFGSNGELQVATNGINLTRVADSIAQNSGIYAAE